MLRAMCPELQERWPEAVRPEDWEGVTMENGRVVQLVLEYVGPDRSVCRRRSGQLTSLRLLRPRRQQADERAGGDRAAHVAAGVGLLDNQLTSLPAEIGQLTSLKVLYLGGNQLTSLPAESLAAHVAGEFGPRRQSADEPAGGDRAAHVAGVVGPLQQSADEPAGGDRAAHVAEGVGPQQQSADELAGGDRAAHVAD